MKQLKDVDNGSRCEHTGMKIVNGKAIPTQFRDGSLRFIKNADSFQTLTPTGKEVIFGLNDLVKVLR